MTRQNRRGRGRRYKQADFQHLAQKQRGAYRPGWPEEIDCPKYGERCEYTTIECRRRHHVTEQEPASA